MLQGHYTDVTQRLQGNYKDFTQTLPGRHTDLQGLQGPYCESLINLYQIWTAYVNNDKIHFGNFQENHSLRIKKQRYNAAGSGGHWGIEQGVHCFTVEVLNAKK